MLPCAGPRVLVRSATVPLHGGVQRHHAAVRVQCAARASLSLVRLVRAMRAQEFEAEWCLIAGK